MHACTSRSPAIKSCVSPSKGHHWARSLRDRGTWREHHLDVDWFEWERCDVDDVDDLDALDDDHDSAASQQNPTW